MDSCWIQRHVVGVSSLRSGSYYHICYVLLHIGKILLLDINFRSHHHPRVKTSIISCLRVRAHNICDNTTLTSEKKHLHVFESNGYPSRTSHKCATAISSQTMKSHSATSFFPFLFDFMPRRVKAGSRATFS